MAATAAGVKVAGRQPRDALRKRMITKMINMTKTKAMIHIHKCKRCDHEWASKREHPIRCAKCKTPYWDHPRNNSSSK